MGICSVGDFPCYLSWTLTAVFAGTGLAFGMGFGGWLFGLVTKAFQKKS